MAFRIVPSPTFRVKVPLTVPGAEARGVVEIEFRHKGRTEFAAWWSTTQGRDDIEVLDDIVAGWSGVVDEADAKVPYSRAALAQVIDRYPVSALEIIRAYHAALWDAREKN